MLKQGLVRALFVGISLVALAGCGGGDDDDDGSCSPPHTTGTWIGGDKGQGKVHGSGTLPAGAKDGMDLELLLGSGDLTASIFPDELQSIATCGKSFSFEIHSLPPGTYTMSFELYSPSNDGTDPDVEGTSTNSFTIAGSEDVAFTPTFP